MNTLIPTAEAVQATLHVAALPSETHTGYAQIRNADGKLVAVVMYPCDRDDAATLELARKMAAVQEMDAALEAEEAADEHILDCGYCGDGIFCTRGHELETAAFTLRRAALAKAKGKEVEATRE